MPSPYYPFMSLTGFFFPLASSVLEKKEKPDLRLNLITFA